MGNIKVDTEKVSDSTYIGGIGISQTINNSVNMGNIDYNATNQISSAHIGGISYSSNVTDSYNGGTINYNAETGYKSYIGKISANTYYSNANGSNYYLENELINLNSHDDQCQIVENTGDTAVEHIEMPNIKSEEYYNILNTNGVWTHIGGLEPKLLINYPIQENPIQVDVTNEINKFNITTEVENKFGIKGGTISGEGEESYEEVRYGEGNQKEIVMIPDSGYIISSITINGNNILSEEYSDGIYTIPANYISNIQEDKRVVVSYAIKEKLLTINKIDSKTSEPLKGAEFEIEGCVNFGPLTTNSQNGFVKVGNKIETNGYNSASSYIEVDLSNKVGAYNILVNVQKASTSLLAVSISDNTNEITDGSPYNKFVYLNSITDAETYSSPVLQGGKKYYLQLKCFGGGGITINSIDLVETEEIEKFENKESEIFGQVNKNSNDSYYFEYTDGKLVPNNNNSQSDMAKSYIEVDLSNKTGKYAIEMKAESNYNNMVAKISENLGETQSENDFYSNQGFMWINGGSKGYGVSEDYSYVSKVLNGGKKYYILMLASSRPLDKTMSINSVRLLKYTEQESFNETEGNQYKETGLLTDSNGQIKVKVPFLGKYIITETKALEGYNLPDSPIEVEVKNIENNTIIIENTRNKSRVTTHHYLKESDGTYTNTKVAEDEIKEYNIGERYETKPRFDLENLTLERKNGNYVITDSASGIIENNDIEVNYYYETSKKGLTIHHYLKGTTTKVANDENITYWPEIEIIDNRVQKVNINHVYKLYENNNYNNLKNEFSLDSIKQGENIVYEKELQFNEDTELTYYYTDAIGVLKVQYLEYQTEKELLNQEETNDKIGKIYNVSVKEIPGYTHISTIGNTTGKFESGEIVVKFYYQQNSQVKVNYIQRKTIKNEEAQTQEPTIEETLLDSKTAKGLVGEVFKASSKNFDNLILVEKPENEIVRMQPQEIELNYYYSPIEVEPEKGKVIEKHINSVTNELIENEEHEFNVGEEYKIEPKEYEGFDLVKSKLPTNAENVAINGVIEVNYYYIRKMSVVAKYIDEATNQAIFDDIIINGYEGDNYTTLKQEKEGFECIVPENANGKMVPNITLDKDGNEIINSTIYVVYKYKENISEPEPEKPEPEKPEPEKPEPEKTEPEIPTIPEKIKKFDLRIDKVISKIVLDGIEQTISNGKLAKTEVHRNKLNDTDIIVEYTIKVSNVGEQAGYATITETIPEGFTMRAEENNGWTIKNNNAKLETGLLNQGEEKEYKVVLHWNKGDNNLGIKVNTASLINETNEKGTKDSNPEDNTSSATLIVTISTGELLTGIDPILGLMIVLLIIASFYVATIINKK